MTEPLKIGDVDPLLASARRESEAPRRAGDANVPDPRFNRPADENSEDARKADKRLGQAAHTTGEMVNQSRQSNAAGTAALGSLSSPSSVTRSSAPLSLLGALTGGGAGGSLPGSSLMPVMSPIQQIAQPMAQFASSMVPAAMQAATAAPAAFNQSYSAVPGDQIVLTPQQQQRLADALAAAEKGGEESTTIGGKNLGEGITGEREQKVVQLAKAVVDAKIPYSWGGGSLTGPSLGISGPGLGANDNNVNGMDCSAFARYVTYQSSGIELPRTSGAQWAASEPVSMQQAKPGDLVFPPGTQGSGHVQIYIGNGQIAEQYQSGTTARITPIDPSYEIRRPKGIAA